MIYAAALFLCATSLAWVRARSRRALAVKG
jgi:hypothetical protein